MRDFLWSQTLAVNFFLTNTPPSGTTIFIGGLHALTEMGGTTSYAGLAGASLTVGTNELSVPMLRGGTPAGCLLASQQADYMECADVTNASSCRAFDKNNHLLNGTTPITSSVATVGSSDDNIVRSDHGGAISITYKPGAKSRVRVEVSVFEWGADSDRLGPF